MRVLVQLAVACALAATAEAGVPSCGGDGGGETCATAEVVAGTGSFFFDNTVATTDGPADPSCSEFGFDQVENDVWFCWTSVCYGLTAIQTCGKTAVDTKITVYEGCGCPAGPPLACNDDTCGLQSLITFDSTPGQTYLIRVGTFPGAPGGPGDLQIHGFCDDAFPAQVTADLCSAPDRIEGVGRFAFDNHGAATDGPPHAPCDDVAIDHDVWCVWTAPCDGSARLRTFASEGVFSYGAVYEGTACPPGPPLACGDLGSTGPGDQFEVTAGTEYLFRLGSRYHAVAVFQVTCNPGPVCAVEDCLAPTHTGLSTSNAVQFTAADAFYKIDDTPVTRVCWWGGSLNRAPPERFDITYYDDAGGHPGDVVAGPFVQGLSLNVEEAVHTGVYPLTGFGLWSHSATHVPAPLGGGTCYWIRIRDVSECPDPRWRWAWSFDGDGSAVLDDLSVTPGFGPEDIVTGHDYAWCIDAPFDTPACPVCAADVNGDDAVDVDDLVAVIIAWGPCPGCPEDIDGDGDIDVDDLVEVIVAWGCGAT